MDHSRSETPPQPVTRLLGRIRAGDQSALRELIPLIYDELKDLARGQLRRLPRSETLNTTVLVHEAYAKLARQDKPAWEDRCHFLGVAARAMRHIAVDYARQKRTEKRGGGRRPITLDRIEVGVDAGPDIVLALDQALRRLSGVSARLAEVVEYRFFGGLTEEETATLLGVTPRTIRRDWVKARAWLYRAMSETEVADSESSR